MQLVIFHDIYAVVYVDCWGGAGYKKIIAHTLYHLLILHIYLLTSIYLSCF